MLLCGYSNNVAVSINGLNSTIVSPSYGECGRRGEGEMEEVGEDKVRSGETKRVLDSNYTHLISLQTQSFLLFCE